MKKILCVFSVAGMCLSMLTPYFVQGIVIGLAGIAGAGVTPLIYRAVLQREKSRLRTEPWSSRRESSTAEVLFKSP